MAEGDIALDYEKLKEDRVFITLCGLIGAGKSTLAKALSDLLGLPAYYEDVDENEYLADFYQDMGKYSFPLQIHLLTKRFRQQQKIVWDGRGAVQDRSLYEDSIFAGLLRDSGLMSERDWRTYIALYDMISNFMRRPHLIVYLRVKPEVSMERIRKRGRECEAGITLEYLQNLYDAYEGFIRKISRTIPVVVVEYDEFCTPEEMANAIGREYLSIHNVREATVLATRGKLGSRKEDEESEIHAKAAELAIASALESSVTSSSEEPTSPTKRKPDVSMSPTIDSQVFSVPGGGSPK